MKKVLMVSCEGLGRGGVQAVMMSIIRSLKSEYQFDVLLFTDAVRHYDEEVLSYGIKIIRIPHYQKGNPLRRKLDYYIRGNGLYKKLRKAIQENGPYDVIHCNNEFESALCLKAAAQEGVPVRIAHTHVITRKTKPVRGLINRRYLKMICSYATHKLACSPAAGISMYGQDGFTAVYNAYDEKRFDPDRYSETTVQKLELVQIGSFSPNKNQLFSLSVLQALLNRNVDAKLHLVGFGDYKQTVLEAIARMELTGHVQLHDADADTPALLSQSSAFLFPSIKEGFGIVLLEAQAMGVRCYVSNSVPRDADVGGCAFLPLSAEQWADKILADYTTLGSKGNFDCSAFSTETIIEKYRSIYRGE